MNQLQLIRLITRCAVLLCTLSFLNAFPGAVFEPRELKDEAMQRLGQFAKASGNFIAVCN